MTEEELRKTIQSGPPPSLEARMEGLKADASAQRTAILRLERQVKHIRISGTIVAAVAGWLLGRSFT
jgi:1,4-dihydroxy-2-naphthoyl-CoA synthase